ncbi:protein of unknown function [Candidatus Hydrogenisulfobacillus filiaventi]|uniref:Uncharacterized protein n=1 Tax=Candidatus Hydrogenisulfobacillus filiaventi TaxID=2707344 RepID=A0A6F8ZFQ5_9FIRM|nr:protein of unknown function [Candidatus Hydrogenisulfobacillus filiaventi]
MRLAGYGLNRSLERRKTLHGVHADLRAHAGRSVSGHTPGLRSRRVTGSGRLTALSLT